MYLASDVQINKNNALSADFTTDFSTANTATNAAKEFKDKINLNSSVHGATASAFNSLTSSFKSEFKMSDTFEINGAVISVATSASNLVDNINRQATGVTATLNADNTITLENSTGEDIIIKDDAGTGATDVGFNVSGGDGALAQGTVYSGFLSLKNNDGTAVQIEANNKANGFSTDNGTINDVTRLGYNQVKNDKSIVSGAVSNSAILTSHDVKINDVAIGVSVGSSAASKAIAINAVTDQTLVTASASNEVTLAVDLDANPATAASAKKVFDFGNFNNVATFTDGVNSVVGSTLATLETNINALTTIDYTASVDNSALKYDGSTAINDANNMASGATSVTVDSTTGFTDTGVIKIGTQYLAYTGKTATSFTGLTLHSGNAAQGNDNAAVVQALGKTDTTIFLDSVSGFDTSGTFKIGSEFITYTGIDTATNSLTGVTRGVTIDGVASTAAVADDNTAVESNKLTITAGASGSVSEAFGSEVFAVTKSAVAQVQSIALANATEVSDKYDKIVLSDGNSEVRFIMVADDSAGTAADDNSTATAGLIALTDSVGEPFQSDITITSDDTGQNLTLTAATAGTAISGTYTAQTFSVGAAAAIPTNAKAITSGTAQTAEIMTVQLGTDSTGAAGDNGGPLAFTNGVLELIATGTAGSGTIFVEHNTDLATSVADLATKINAASGLNFTALAGPNGDLTLTMKTVGATKLTDSTIVVNSYSYTQNAGVSATTTTANTAGTSLFSTDTNAVAAGIVSLNGTTIDMTAADELSDVVSAINSAGIGDLEASGNVDGTLKITSVGGSNIAIRDTSSGFITSITDATSTAVDISTRASSISDSDGVTAFGILNLKSSGDGIIKVSGDDESVLGLAAQAETQTLVSGGIKVNTLTDATQALVDIDKAIEKVSSFRSSFGAVENRIDASINNLTTLKVNTEAAKSRIEDADFASETSRLTKSQILSQAATSMLAQANASKQNLLALLQG